ncbi:MAG: zinc-ribbon domain-containing protein [Candidatus Competibacteraceae bacterium]|nr:zinc-ribbon domain-containing protein [Candidatus Competibacteraceae bacterium]
MKIKLYIEDVIEPAAVRSQSFAKACPEAASMWLYKRNCGFGPEDFSHGSTVWAWFKCPKGRDHISRLLFSLLQEPFGITPSLLAAPFVRGGVLP